MANIDYEFKGKDFEDDSLIGIIFDISLRHSQGIRHLDWVKNALVDLAIKLEPYGKFYVSHCNSALIPVHQGGEVASIVRYTEEDDFSLDKAFKRAISVIGEGEKSSNKFVFYFTDRFVGKWVYSLVKAYRLNKSYDCNLFLISIGDEVEDKVLRDLSDEHGGTFFKANLSTLSADLLNFVKEKNARKSSLKENF